MKMASDIVMLSQSDGEGVQGQLSSWFWQFVQNFQESQLLAFSGEVWEWRPTEYHRIQGGALRQGFGGNEKYRPLGVRVGKKAPVLHSF